MNRWLSGNVHKMKQGRNLDLNVVGISWRWLGSFTRLHRFVVLINAGNEACATLTTVKRSPSHRFTTTLLNCQRTKATPNRPSRITTKRLSETDCDRFPLLADWTKSTFFSRLYPDYESALMNLGNLYRDRKDYDLAEQYIRRSIEAL